MRTATIFFYTLLSAVLLFLFYKNGNTDAVIAQVFALAWFGLCQFQGKLLEEQNQLIKGLTNDTK